MLKSSHWLFSACNSNITILLESNQFLLRIHPVLGILDRSQDLHHKENSKRYQMFMGTALQCNPGTLFLVKGPHLITVLHSVCHVLGSRATILLPWTEWNLTEIMHSTTTSVHSTAASSRKSSINASLKVLGEK